MCGVHGDAVVAQPLHRDGWVSSIAIRQLTKPSLPLVARYKRIRLIYIYSGEPQVLVVPSPSSGEPQVLVLPSPSFQ